MRDFQIKYTHSVVHLKKLM